MTERITIQGRDLTVTHDQAKPDPKRIRPERFASSPGVEARSPSGWTLNDMIDMPNPFWPEEG